jgi:hypothetical protein
VNSSKQTLRPAFIERVLLGVGVVIVLLLIGYVVVFNRVSWAPTWVEQSGRRWHEPAVGESFDGLEASYNHTDRVTIQNIHIHSWVQSLQQPNVMVYVYLAERFREPLSDPFWPWAMTRNPLRLS